MEVWFLILVTLFVAALLRATLNLLSSAPNKKSLPPGPLTFPIVGNFLWLRKSLSELEPVLRSLHTRYGPMVTLHIGSQPAVFVASPTLAHEALIHRGAVFADRPPPSTTVRLLSSNQKSIITSSAGPTWRLLRRNLTAEILHPSRLRSYSRARTRVLNMLGAELKSQPGGVVRVIEHFQSFYELRECRKRVLIPLIRARLKAKQEQLSKAKENRNDGNGDWIVPYVDTLLDLELPEQRKLEEDQIISLWEFLSAGTDTTSTALQWIMANLVKYPEIQERLYDEIKSVVGQGAEQVKEEDLERMAYLKAVVLEGLRRHPPAHFVLPHAVKEDAELGGYTIPKDAIINFMVAEMGWNAEIWEEPMAFKPERFLNSGGGGEASGFDITGSKEIKMMPFGVGRRICPASGLAMLHLEYFVANLVWQFKWRTVAGEEVDLSEKQEFTMVMKNPLRAQISSRN
ncbi:hypothetical protein EUGRSUZ_H01145 [Eucalyptus grandis]|uniref:Uncharacterized protein n=1 Tax=Eucalyptus grandis TaxID=71139 RepID=A0ACC3JN85_EUCGR|nr:hypothetical protein EUGRSUZ_H01145 [Eucalyptus grandis]